jgi:hypothetical protein
MSRSYFNTPHVILAFFRQETSGWCTKPKGASIARKGSSRYWWVADFLLMKLGWSFFPVWSIKPRVSEMPANRQNLPRVSEWMGFAFRTENQVAYGKEHKSREMISRSPTWSFSSVSSLSPLTRNVGLPILYRAILTKDKLLFDYV